MAEDQNLHSLIRSLLGLSAAQQPMETNALLRELVRRIVLSGAYFDSTTGVLTGAAFDAATLDSLDSLAFARLGSANAGHLLFTDATYDIGASGATRPRDLFLSRNAVIGGTTSFGGNVVSNLLFTDATYDIGASGATRPRDLFLSRNATVGGTLGVTGVTTFTADARTTAWTDYTATSTIVGWASFTTGKKWIFYKKVGNLVLVNFYIEGTSDATTTTFTLPHAAVTVGTQFEFGGVLMTTIDNGGFTGPGVAILPDADTVVTVHKTTAQAAWTGSGTKAIGGQFWYEAA